MSQKNKEINMKSKIGIIGGLSPESTVSYYLYFTRMYSEITGDSNIPEIIIYSVNNEKYHNWRNHNRWDLIAQDITNVAEKLKQSGADIGLIATNTMHKVFNEVTQNTDLVLYSLLDAVSYEIQKKNINKVGLIGTKFSMNDGFYQKYLYENGIDVITPNENDQLYIHNKIETELVKGKFLDDTRMKFIEIIDSLKKNGAQGIILGCTEIPLLISQENSDIPVFDTATIHADFVLRRFIESTL